LPVVGPARWIYPLADAAKPPATNFVNVSGKAFNTIHAMHGRVDLRELS
jgi:hypothetical protein